MSMVPADPDPDPDSRLPAWEAAAGAAAATEATRRLLDLAGRRGATTVNESRSIPGARRASTKAQIRLEESARKLEESHQRFAALTNGVALDLGMAEDGDRELLSKLRLTVAVEFLEESLRLCEESLADPEAMAIARAALDRLRATSRSG
ncbi:MAG: hypothetical protein ACREOL_06510 [Candidatus Dormibacteria bacterium]